MSLPICKFRLFPGQHSYVLLYVLVNSLVACLQNMLSIAWAVYYVNCRVIQSKNYCRNRLGGPAAYGFNRQMLFAIQDLCCRRKDMDVSKKRLGAKAEHRILLAPTDHGLSFT